MGLNRWLGSGGNPEPPEEHEYVEMVCDDCGSFYEPGQIKVHNGKYLCQVCREEEIIEDATDQDCIRYIREVEAEDDFLLKWFSGLDEAERISAIRGYFAIPFRPNGMENKRQSLREYLIRDMKRNGCEFSKYMERNGRL